MLYNILSPINKIQLTGCCKHKQSHTKYDIVQEAPTLHDKSARPNKYTNP